MTSSAIPHVSCNHVGPDFDWWRCNDEGYVGRPPSPFPASFEHARQFREDSADATYGRRGLTTEVNGDGGQCNGDAELDETSRRLYWPLCQGPEIVVSATEENNDLGLTPRGGLGGKKSPRRPHKRPAWVPAKMPNKWGVAGHPPPYTNYCKETIFNTRTADPAKPRPSVLYQYPYNTTPTIHAFPTMESCCPQACHRENHREHSGQIFDWWRCSKDGQILNPVPQDPIIPPMPAPPLRRDHLCWPMYKGAEQTKDIKPKNQEDDCEVSRDFWPDSWDKTGKRPSLEHARPPFLPAFLPNQFGVVKYPPPYTHYCRTREPPLNYVCKI